MAQNLTSPTTVRDILQSLDIKPSKALGQNFLVDRNILNILLKTAKLTPADHVIEIGPGLGAVTQELLKQTGGVTAIEKDRNLFAYLQHALGSHAGLSLHCADALDMHLGALVEQGSRVVVANLPYVAGSRILMEFAKAPTPPQRMIVTVQKEVGDRLTATPGTSEYGLLSLWIQLIYRTELIHTIPPTCFWPRPTVRSAIVQMIQHTESPALPYADAECLRTVSRYAFMHRRKQLAKLLSQTVQNPAQNKEAWQRVLSECNLDPHARPGALAPQDWRRLTTASLCNCHLSN
ncbi:MAG: ribosomal RNA small subunit methyltransferase A [Kiritimatiellae bacterium]|nr:ribosomal RNA small subunit methyltransferase A [Kiritimatiellia bacterium]